MVLLVLMLLIGAEQSVRAILDRAMEDFRVGRVEQSLAGVDRVALLSPSEAPYLWQRSQGQHLLRSEGVRQHALQPRLRSAVRVERDRLGKAGAGHFLSGSVDATRTGIIGYSMGGYGVVNVVGGGFSAASAAFSKTIGSISRA